MRRFLVGLAALLPAASILAGDSSSPGLDAIWDIGDVRPEIHLRSIDGLIENADVADVLKLARSAGAAGGTGGGLDSSQDRRCRYGGARYCIDLARRYAATEVGSVARWMTLEELMRSSWKGHVTAVLRRAGLTAQDAARVLIERAQAELTCQECFDKAISDVNFEDPSFAEAARRGNAVVPHALGILAVPPWIAMDGWPRGPTVMKQRRAVKIVTKAKAGVAVPFLLQHVDAPSAMLQFDVLHALAELTGDATWAASDLFKLDALSAQRAAWWKQEGKAYGDAARWFALDGLQIAADYQFAVAHGQKLKNYDMGDAPNPVEHLFKTIELLTGRKAPELDGTPWKRTWDVVEAIRHFEGLD